MVALWSLGFVEVRGANHEFDKLSASNNYTNEGPTVCQGPKTPVNRPGIGRNASCSESYTPENCQLLPRFVSRISQKMSAVFGRRASDIDTQIKSIGDARLSVGRPARSRSRCRFYVPRLRAYYLTRNTSSAFVRNESARVFASASLIDIRAVL